MKFNQIVGFVWTLGTGVADLAGNIYRGVKITPGSTDQGGTALAITAVSDNVVGFQSNNPTGPNQNISLDSDGIVLAEVGATVTGGSEVSIMADGKIENKNATNTIVGTALTSGAVNDIISIKLKNM